MNQLFLYAIGSVLLASLLSLIGIITFFVRSSILKHNLIYLVSFGAGALFGDAFLHLLPEAVEETGSLTLAISISLLLGIILSFIIEKFIHWHHCHHLDHAKHKHHLDHQRQGNNIATMNLFGDAMHNLLDGIIIGTSYIVSIPVGIATTIAVLLHELPQELGDFGILLHSGLSKAKALFYNFLVSLTALLGVVVAFFLNQYVEHLTTSLLPFSAGVFIYIAGSDLIPELHHEIKLDRSVMQLAMFVLGIIIMLTLLFLE
ncbi:ZIP family metal transporter [Candidatus Woesearchaeota archaeon]|nr:ZIP family metal transporter [Candidatus Woesearchaeota archaeon]